MCACVCERVRGACVWTQRVDGGRRATRGRVRRETHRAVFTPYLDFQWTKKAKWIDHMAITGSNTDRVVDVNDDLARETFFYERALESANECVRRLKELGVPARRPDDYYAEMVKSDEHMKRVRSELIFEQQQLEIRDERRKAREAKKYGKQVQAEKIKARTLDKKSQIKSLDKWRKQRQKSGFADDGKVPFDGADDGKRKRQQRDEKWGFGGRKKVRLSAASLLAIFFRSRKTFRWEHGVLPASRVSNAMRRQDIYDVYLSVNTLHKLGGCRPLSGGRLPSEGPYSIA